MLKDKLINSFTAFENNHAAEVDSDFHSIRTAAIMEFEEEGFPSKKVEEWKYSSLKNLIQNDYKLFPLQSGNELTAAEVNKYLLKGTESYKIVFVDGVYQPYLSETTHEGMDICLLSAAIEKTKYKVVLDYYFNKIAKQVKNGITSLNTAFSSEGAFIHIPKGTIVDKPIQIIYFTTQNEKEVLLQPRNLIIIDENAQVKIVERHQSLSKNHVFNNTVTEIFANRRAVVDYYKIQNDLLNASLIDSTFVQQKDQSNVTINTYSFGGDFTRNNLYFYHEGEYINSNLNGISMIKGNQHVDNQTNIFHQKPNCESHELYKGIYDDQSTGVFNGKVMVSKEAQKTDAFQQNDNILLTDEATINAKPQLEIFADDVKCSHGCTIGQLDKNALFYMNQRGIPTKEAKALLLYAFTDEVVSRIKIPALKTWITSTISEKLGVQLEIEI